mgnify:CR=1 FL=1
MMQVPAASEFPGTGPTGNGIATGVIEHAIMPVGVDSMLYQASGVALLGQHPVARLYGEGRGCDLVRQHHPSRVAALLQPELRWS